MNDNHRVCVAAAESQQEEEAEYLRVGSFVEYYKSNDANGLRLK